MLCRLLILGIAVALGAQSIAYAQAGAAIAGAIVDESKGVLPGVTVTATELDTGRQHVGVSDERGEYRLVNVSPGRYRVQADLPGFASVVMPRVELLVGQNAAIPFTMKVATLEETITVTREAPLVDVTSSQIAGNVDRRQMEELPLQGRNWIELAMMVKGNTANSVGNQPGVREEQYQLNLDGQQITQKIASSSFGQLRISREAIAEFQIVTNLFDITQGRSAGVQVQAVSRSGTNALAGSFYGFFRDDRFNAADFVAGRVLPYQNQQVGVSLGGPIVRDKLHYFLSYEYEREPSTIFAQPAQLPNQSFTFDSKNTQKTFLARVDQALTARDQLSFRGSYSYWDNPFVLGSASHPSEAVTRTQLGFGALGTWTRVLSDNKVQELKVGYNYFDLAQLLGVPEMATTSNFVFPGLTVGGPRNFPQWFYQKQLSARYDLTWHRDRHDFKIGGEFLGWKDYGEWHLLERGEYIFNTRPPDLERRFPADSYNNPAAWDVSGLDARVQRFDQNFGDWTFEIPRPTWAIWFGDTWKATDKLTLNFGVRWDDDWGVTAPPYVTTAVTWDPVGGNPFDGIIAINPGDRLFRSDIRDHDNIAPRFGFAYNVTGTNDLVVRGGTGLYYSTPISNVTFSQQSFNGQRLLVNSFVNDGQPGFIGDPTRGLANEDFRSGAAPLPPQSPRVIAHDFKMPYTWQNVLGFQKQLSPVMGVEADLTHWKEYNSVRARDINLFFDTATGYNKDIGTFGRPDPKFTQIHWMESTGAADSMALSTAITRRFQNNFQAALTYTYMFYKHDNTTGFSSFFENQFDNDSEWARSADFQRHTLRSNAIVNLPWSISLAGSYFYGSGNYTSTTVAGRPYGKPGTNRLNIGAPITIPEALRDRFEGPGVIGTNEVVPKNALRNLPLHKVDLRLSKQVSLGGTMKLSGIVEVFNVLNHANYGAYTGQVDSARFGEPQQSLNNAYLARAAQFAFRLAF
jgi:hypothetical protein